MFRWMVLRGAMLLNDKPDFEMKSELKQLGSVLVLIFHFPLKTQIDRQIRGIGDVGSKYPFPDSGVNVFFTASLLYINILTITTIVKNMSCVL